MYRWLIIEIDDFASTKPRKQTDLAFIVENERLIIKKKKKIEFRKLLFRSKKRFDFLNVSLKVYVSFYVFFFFTFVYRAVRTLEIRYLSFYIIFPIKIFSDYSVSQSFFFLIRSSKTFNGAINDKKNNTDHSTNIIRAR